MLKKGDVFNDFSSADGKVIIIASKEYSTKAIGTENSFFLCLISKINSYIKKGDVSVIRKNYFEFSFADGDILYIYASKEIMKKLEEKLLKERTKVKVVSCSFSFPNIKPIKKLKTAQKNSIYVYQI